MKTVNDILGIKGHDVLSIRPEATLFEALQRMEQANVGALLVLDATGICGMVSERDYARKVILKGKASKQTPVREIMTSEIFCVDPMYSVEECMAVMTDKRIRHLPVIENDNVVGLISIGDVVKALISEKEFAIEQLERYIRGHR
jgi:CBS domain-containing protein